MLDGLTAFTPESILSLFDNLEFAIRILLSGVLGVCIGLERSIRLKEAGIRTHCIIACTSAVFMILSKYAFMDLASELSVKIADPSRMAAQVVCGISFLGAGVIFKQNGSITGLTTAAGMWATASVGMAVGAGLYWVGLIEAAIVVLIQLVLHRFPVGNDALVVQEMAIEMDDERELRLSFDGLVKKHGGKIIESETRRENQRISMKVVIRLEQRITHEESIRFLDGHPGVYKISV